jgi:hypothetical protein
LTVSGHSGDTLYWSVVWTLVAFALLLSIPLGLLWLLYHTALAVIEFVIAVGS